MVDGHAVHPIRGTAGTARGADTDRSNEWLDDRPRSRLGPSRWLLVISGQNLLVRANSNLARGKRVAWVTLRFDEDTEVGGEVMEISVVGQ